ncbi:MAG: CCA tRNA nucleotidyltransferase [Vicinamibacterales bacterium]
MTDDEALRTALAIARAVRDAGGRGLFVGGWVRDRLLGHAGKDIDLEVYGLEIATVKALLEQAGSVNTVGESFTVFKLGSLDVSIPRRESKSGRGHRGFEVTGDPWLSVREASRRRDFTINAISWDPLTGVYEDPFDGRRDLDARLLRVVDPATFGEDSLRVLRALQFAARFELRVDDESRQICRQIALDDLPSERVWEEIDKLLRRARRPSIGWHLAHDLGVLDRLFPECVALVGCPQEPEWHPEGDVWTHTLMVVDEARLRIDDLSHPEQVVMMLAAVAHDFGKPATTALSEGRIRSPGHEEAGVEPTLSFLDRLNVHSLDGYDVRRQVVAIVANHLKPGMWHKAPAVGDAAFRRLALRVDLELLARLAEADCRGRTGSFDCGAMAWFRERAQALGVEHRPPEPLLLGRHVLALGVRPGPLVGEILRQIYELQLDGRIATFDAAQAHAQQLVEESRSYGDR